jgi:hypothetical protein
VSSRPTRTLVVEVMRAGTMAPLAFADTVLAGRDMVG